MKTIEGNSFGYLWDQLLREIIKNGVTVSPRDKPTIELRDVTLHLTNSIANILVCDVRRPSHRFMVAEWLWIFFGHDDVATIAAYAPVISQFSDDGKRFSGAYGPPVKDRWPHLVRLLKRDPNTRQAVIPIYRPVAEDSKDVPCTLTLQFLLRDGRLHTTASMRSSDVWLGLPYDVFNFTMLGNIMAAEVGAIPGEFTIHLASSHLYEVNFDAADRVLRESQPLTYVSPVLPGPPPMWLDEALRDTLPVWSFGLEPWNRYERVLRATNYQAAREAIA
jgi:thymidylate synthase